jgi:hypothetical protein
VKAESCGPLPYQRRYSQRPPRLGSIRPNKHQLQSVSLNGGTTQSYSHDENGNITQRGAGGLTLVYDIDNLPRTIQQDSRKAEFYTAQGGRWLQRLNGRDTYYLGKSYELELNGGSVSTERYYLSSGALLIVKTGQSRNLNYLHMDRLGSPVSITEKVISGTQNLGSERPTLVEHKGFDPFGKALDTNWGTSNNGYLNLPANGLGINQNQRNQRGFTGHEHLDEFALIYMNG